MSDLGENIPTHLPDKKKEVVLTGVVLMSPDAFPVISLKNTAYKLRYHHIVNIHNMMTLAEGGIPTYLPDYSLENLFDPEKSAQLQEAYKEFLFHSDEKLTEGQRKEIALRVAAETKKLFLRELPHDAQRNDIKIEDYIGPNGQQAEQYQQGVLQVVFDVLSLPSEARIHLSFSSDADPLCSIKAGAMAHCTQSNTPKKEDFKTWLKVNKVACEWKEGKRIYPRINTGDLGLISIGRDNYDVYITVGALRTALFINDVANAKIGSNFS